MFDVLEMARPVCIRLYFDLIKYFTPKPFIFKNVVFFLLFYPKSEEVKESKRKAMNRNWYNQKANPALITKAGNK